MRYDMIIYFQEDTMEILDVSVDEVADFMELYPDAESFSLLQIDDVEDNGPIGGLRIAA